MKLQTLLLTYWGASAVASPLQKRQNQLASFVNSLPASYIIQPLKTELLKPQVRAGAIRKQIRYGPFKLPGNKLGATPTEAGGHGHGGGGGAMGGKGGKETASQNGVLNGLEILTGQKPMDPHGFSQMRVLPEGALCKNCTVLAGKMDVIFDNGTRADISSGVYLHHVVTIDLSKQTKRWVGSCGADPSNDASKTATGQNGGNTFIGGAVDSFTQFFTTPDGKFNSGYFVDDNKFMMQVEMINYRLDEQTVYILTDLEYVDGHTGGDATQATLGATGCGGFAKIWRPAKNSSGNVVADGYKVLANGHIIASRGHLHDGGTSVMLYVNNELKCTSTAIYGGDGGQLTIDGKKWETISKMTECNDPVPVKVGDVIKLEGTYDTKMHPLRDSNGEEQEAMALMFMMFVPEVK